MRWFKTVGGLVVIMLLMASCIRVDGAIKIEDDGSGTVNFLSAVNAESLTSVLGDFDIPESEFGEASEICDDFSSAVGDTSELPPGATVTPYDEDGFCGARLQYALTPSLDQSANITEILDPSARLYKDGDNWFFETDFNTDEITSGADGAPDAMFDALFADASFRFTVDLPGRAVAGLNNATEVGDDGQFTWDIDILNPPTRLFAQTEPGSGGGTSSGGGLNPIIIILVLALLAAGLAFFFINKRKNGAAQDTATPNDISSAGMPTGASPFAAPVVPVSDAAKETVVMNAADVQQSIQDAIADPAAVADAVAADPVAADPVAAETPGAALQPVFDEALNAWVVDDPARGRLRHDPATDTWNPA